MAEMKALKEDFLHCSICTNRFKVPKVLPCIHSFCEGCLESYLQRLKSKLLPCPICREICDLTNTGVKGLQTNFYIVNLGERMDLFGRLDKVSSNRQTCDSCESNDVLAYCIECDSRICPKCQGDHTRFPVLRSHKIIPTDQIKQPKYQQMLQNAKAPFCEVHPTESLRFYCNTCSKLICRDCTIVQHPKPNHDCVEASYQLDNIKKTLTELLSESSTDLKSSRQFFEKGKAGLEAVKRQSESIIKDINASYVKMMTSIENQLKSQVKQMCAEVTDATASQTNAIEEGISEASTWVSRMENTQVVTQKVLDENNMWEILAMSHDLISSFKALNLEVDGFQWCQSDLKQNMVFWSHQSPSVTLGKCSGGYDVVVSDTQGNFIMVRFDRASSMLEIVKVRKDKSYNLDEIDGLASFKVNLAIPKHANVKAAISSNSNTIYIGLGRYIFVKHLSSNSSQTVLETSKDEEIFITFLTCSISQGVLFLNFNDDVSIKRLNCSQFGWYSGSGSNQRLTSTDVTAYLNTTQLNIPETHIPIHSVNCYNNTLVYLPKKGISYGNCIYTLSREGSTKLALNSADMVRHRNVLSVFEGCSKGSRQVLSQRNNISRYVMCDMFTCYMLWDKPSSSSSKSQSTFVVTEYDSVNQNINRTWKVPAKCAQPVACYLDNYTKQLIVCDPHGKCTVCY